MTEEVTTQDLNALRAKLAAAASHSRQDMAQRLDAAEVDVLFLSLMNRALLQILLDNELCSMQDVVNRMKYLDELDGEVDGGLQTDVLAEDIGVEKPSVAVARRQAERLGARGCRTWRPARLGAPPPPLPGSE